MNSYKRHWAIRWFFVDQPLVPISTASLRGSTGDLATLTDIFATENRAILGCNSNLASAGNSPVPPVSEVPAAESMAKKDNTSNDVDSCVTPVGELSKAAQAYAHCDCTIHVTLASALALVGFVLGRYSAKRF